jgi:hypothetical protein
MLLTRWLISVAGAGVVMMPLLHLGWLQRGAVSWLKPPTWAAVPALAFHLAGSAAIFVALAAHERPGDAVYYPKAVPAWNITYPAGFGRLRDVSLGEAVHPDRPGG